ncbi:MAG: hypothetical protein SCM11_09475 [Bacillota bacterium]|nr:hypothetical protein [Bacillota bacterium]
MKLKILLLLITFVTAMSFLASCSPASSTTTSVDVVSSASVVDNAEKFEKAISKDGTWIIALTKDLTIDKELVVDGDFKNGKTDAAGNELLQRKIALYTQDADRNITARFTLTVKKLTINSANASIQHGTFIGDLYVNVEDFQLIDATVDGNVYFLNEEIKSSFTMDEASKITGVQEIKAD